LDDYYYFHIYGDIVFILYILYMYIWNNGVCCEHAIVVGGKEGGETVAGAGQ